MNMNIKKIIKEEMDDFDWIRKSEPIDLDKEVKDYVDNDFVVAVWFGDIDGDLKEHINKFIIKENFKWTSDGIEEMWIQNQIKGITFYPHKLMGAFIGVNARINWVDYNQNVKNGEYDDINPNMFHSIEYK